MDLRTPFGLKNGRLHGPLEVERGLSSGCVCPGCGQDLIANQGVQKQAYFSHRSGSDCSSGYETAVHLMAKQVVADAGWVTGASVTFADMVEAGMHREWVKTYSEPQMLLLTNVELEQSALGKRPDIVGLVVDGQVLYVEIAVTHPVDADKRHLFSDKNMLEIDLSKVPRHVVADINQFQDLVLKTAPRAWIACQLYGELRAQHQRDVVTKRAELSLLARRESTKRNRTPEEQQDLAQAKQTARAPYEPALSTLMNMQQGLTIQNTIDALAEGGQAKLPMIEQALGLDESRPWPRLLDKFHRDGWIYPESHRVVGAQIMRYFIKPRLRFSRFDVITKLEEWYPLTPWVAPLVNLKREHLANGRAEKSWKAKHGVWFFSKLENDLIPDPFWIVGDFLEDWVEAGIISTDPKHIWYTVELDSIADIHAAIYKFDETNRYL